MKAVNHFLFSASLTCLASLIAGIFFASKRSWAKRIFGLFWLATSFWSFTAATQQELLEWLPERVWGWFLHLGCVLVPIVFFHFTALYTGNGKSLSGAVLIGYGIAASFLLLNAFTRLFTFGTEYRDDYAYPKPAVLYPLYIFFFQVAGAWATVLLFRLRAAISSDSRALLNWFLVFHVLAYAGAMDNYLIMYDVRIFPVYPFGLYLVVPYAIFGSFLVSKIQNPMMSRTWLKNRSQMI